LIAWATCEWRESPRSHVSSSRTSDAPFSPGGEALLTGHSIDVALHIEQEIDAFGGLKGDQRDRRGGLFPTRIGCDVGEHEELAPGMASAERLCHRSGVAVGEIEPLVAHIGIGLEDAGELLQISLGMVTRAVVKRCAPSVAKT